MKKVAEWEAEARRREMWLAITLAHIEASFGVWSWLLGRIWKSATRCCCGRKRWASVMTETLDESPRLLRVRRRMATEA